ncbi:MAG TPA: hypothetical protein VMX17_00715, partial [Candidatus Glassbacteria bacterium]|nr:hypothetical protein [Candidatus Glassbacteria bacterium]
MESIYRFTTFESFVDIVQSRELTFVSPSLWEDPYESYIFSAMKTERGRLKLNNLLKKYLLPENVGSNLAVLNSFDVAIFGQCWTLNPESDALWRIYSHENFAVRIEIDRSDAGKLNGVNAYDVEYVESMNLE